MRKEAARRPLLAFFVIAFSSSWAYELVVVALLDLPLLPWAVPAIFGPAVAAVYVSGALEGRAGIGALLRGLLLWRVGLRWYLFALVGVPMLLVASFVFLPEGTASFDDAAPGILLTWVATFLVIFLVGGGQEEIGWRGFALPRMQERLGPLAASVTIGVLWGIWHLPLFAFVPDYDNAGSGVLGIAATFVVFTVCFTVGFSLIVTWLFNHTRGSVLLAVVLHASVNATFALAPETRLGTMSLSLALAVIALFLVGVSRGRLGYRKPSEPVRRSRPELGLGVRERVGT